MSAKLEREAIGTLFASGWGSTTAVAVPNAQFTPPRGEWVRLTIIDSDAFPVEIGRSNVQRRHPGNVIVNVFVPLGTGDNRALELAEQAAQIFRATPRVALTGGSGDIRFRDPVVRTIGRDSEGAFFQVNVTVPFWRDAVT